MVDYTPTMSVREQVWTEEDATFKSPDLDVGEQTVVAPPPQNVYASDVAPLPFANANFRVPAPDVADEVPPPRTLDYSWQQPLNKQVAGWMSLFVEDGQVVELRALNVEQSQGFKRTWCGYYTGNKLDRMASDAMELTGDAEGVYFMLNPVNPDLLARCANRVEATNESTKDPDIVSRRFLLLDVDPKRKSRISSSDQEKQEAWDLIRNVHQYLKEQGWPEPILSDSGNGYHMFYRIDLPCDDGGLVKDVLASLAQRFNNAKAEIDTTVFNPARICKLPGSISRKGDSIQTRPHRRSGVLNVPPKVEVVTREQLIQVRGEMPGTTEVPATQPAIVVAPASTLIAGARVEAMQSARNYLSKVPGAIEGQKGSNKTIFAACTVVRFGLNDEDCMTLLREWNQKCQPPWTEKELQKKLRDGRIKAGSERMAQRREGVRAVEAADDPHRLAEVYLNKSRVDGFNTLAHWRGDWYRWNGTAYVMVSDDEIKAAMTAAIKNEFDQLSRVEQLPVAGDNAEPTRPSRVRKVTTTLVNNAMQALRSECFLSSTQEAPFWLDDEERVPANEVLVATNGWVHLPSLIDGKVQLEELTPKLFTTAALDYEIDANAGEPKEWLKFLGELWRDDPESIALLQEWFGYNLVPDTRQQKMLLIVGPKRAGKGTIARVLTGLVGQSNVVGPTLNSLAGDFGMSALINKPTAIIADARFSGRAAEQAVVLERLLSISGEDQQSINRKQREFVHTKLPTRFTILTNELPRLNDASAVLASRLMSLQLKQSWFGNEDTGLLERLLQERPGIFRWACAGLQRLRQRGRFVQPSSGAETIRRLVELSSPVTAFVAERCELGGDKTIAKSMLFDMWRSWCTENGHEPGCMAVFAKNLMAAFPDVQGSKQRDGGGSRLQTYRGIGMLRL